VVAIDPRKLKPSELCRLLNSTPLGAVIDDRQLYRHRMRAGLRVGDSKHVDLLRYVAWLIEVRHAPKSEPEGDPYETLKERARARNIALSLAGRDIGDLPAVVNPQRKEKAASDFRFFCDQYFPLTFHMPWASDHLKVIAKIEEAVLRGGLFAMAMPRGSGKSTICECACIWAVLNGHREFVCLIGSDEGHAMDMLDSIKMELGGNDLLLEDFPEAVYPIQCLDGIANRCSGQLHKGQRTHIGWTAREIVLPTIDGSKASAAIIKVAGITGGIRGRKHKRADGQTVRPSLVVLDDPQTDESARSPSQCATRENILAGAVLGMAGPGKKISGIMPCTVIRPGDMADHILDRNKHPEWNGERTKMVYQFPTQQKLWDEYAVLRAEGFRQGDSGAAATEFYRQHREAMDEGAVVAWPQRHHPDELSAIQHAMNLKLFNERAFYAEYQNEPLLDVIADENALTADQVANKLNGRARGSVPQDCTHVTAFIDVQATALFYVVAAWEPDFTGYVVDYGTFPDQHLAYFTLREVKRTLLEATKASGGEGAIYAGLQTLVAQLMGRDWKTDGGQSLRIGKLLIDANWSDTVIYQFCRQSIYSAVLQPSHGKGIGASSLPMTEWNKKPGEQRGHFWVISPGDKGLRRVIMDVNYWKSFVHSRLKVSMGERGCLSLFGEKAEMHRLFADHVTAEQRIRTIGRGREVDEWKNPERRDNHWLDALVGSTVAASILGVSLGVVGDQPRPPVKTVSFAQQQREAWARQGYRGRR
jgi:hypothetical protein